MSDAARHYRQAAALDPESTSAREGGACVHAALVDQTEAKKTLAARHFQNCLTIIDRILDLSPAAHTFSAMKAQCMVGLNRMQEASGLIAALLTRSPGNSEALYVRGLYYCQQGKLEPDGIGHFKQVLRSDPEHAASKHALKAAKAQLKHKQRGNEKFRDGDLPDAMACYSSALELDPDNNLGMCHVLRVNRAVVQGKLGATDAAISDCTAALGIDARYTKARMKRADLYVQKGDLDEAQEDYSQVLVEEPAHKQRAQIQKALRDIEAKLKAAEKQTENLYAVLGIGESATATEIKKAYRKMAMKHHPDRVQGEQEKRRAEKQFKHITKAYTTLSDVTQKSTYDRERRYSSPPKRGGGGSRSSGGGFWPGSYSAGASSYGAGASSYGAGASSYGAGGGYGRGRSYRDQACSDCGENLAARKCSQYMCAMCCRDPYCPHHA